MKSGPREVFAGQKQEGSVETIYGPGSGPAREAATDDETARAGHVDARIRTTRQPSRAVWDNPVLWREICTWAYGRKVMVIRVAYVLLFLLAAGGLYYTVTSGALEATSGDDSTGGSSATHGCAESVV